MSPSSATVWQSDINDCLKVEQFPIRKEKKSKTYSSQTAGMRCVGAWSKSNLRRLTLETDNLQMMRDRLRNWYLSIGPHSPFSIPSFNEANVEEEEDRFQPEDHRQVFYHHGGGGKEGIFPDPGVLRSSIFSRSSNGQGQRRPRQFDSPIVMDPLLLL